MAEKKKFEDKISELENIINELESGNISLDDSINKYTKAMTLAKECDQELKKIEEQISKIVNENNDLEDFSIDSN